MLPTVQPSKQEAGKAAPREPSGGAAVSTSVPGGRVSRGSSAALSLVPTHWPQGGAVPLLTQRQASSCALANTAQCPLLCVLPQGPAFCQGQTKYFRSVGLSHHLALLPEEEACRHMEMRAMLSPESWCITCVTVPGGLLSVPACSKVPSTGIAAPPPSPAWALPDLGSLPTPGSHVHLGCPSAYSSTSRKALQESSGCPSSLPTIGLHGLWAVPCICHGPCSHTAI